VGIYSHLKKRFTCVHKHGVVAKSFVVEAFTVFLVDHARPCDRCTMIAKLPFLSPSYFVHDMRDRTRNARVSSLERI
jgi:hypothetical protein